MHVQPFAIYFFPRLLGLLFIARAHYYSNFLLRQLSRDLQSQASVCPGYEGHSALIHTFQSFLLLACILSCDAYAQWNAAQTVGTKAGLRGIHNAGGGIVWASGSGGTVLRSEDDGLLWQKCAVPPGAAKLDFRAVWAWDAKHAVAMSSGSGDASRLYETTDGCATWHVLLRNPDAAGFWDGLVFAGPHGLLTGDPVYGRFTVFRTVDGGQHWLRETSAQLAADKRGEGIFAASNSALAVRPPGPNFIFGTGGIGGPRVFTANPLHSLDGKQDSWTWTVTRAPLARGTESAGILSLAFRNLQAGVAVGGDYKRPQASDGTAVFTSDGGVHWTLSTV